MKSQYSIRYFFREGIRAIFLNGFMSFAAISVIVVCLLITGSISLIVTNIGAQINALEQDNEIAIYIDESFSRDEAEDISLKLFEIENIKEAVFVSSEQALEEFAEMMGDDELIAGLQGEHNPMRDGYRIKLHDNALLAETKEEILNISGIANFVAQEDTVSTLLSLRDVFEIISITLVISLGAVSVFIISNTVKLGMFARREEIAIMKMVGATNWFIRWPFVVEGLILGLVSSFIAFFVQWGIYYELQVTISEFLGIITIIDFSEINLLVAGVFLAAGLLIGVSGSSLTIRKFLDV